MRVQPNNLRTGAEAEVYRKARAVLDEWGTLTRDMMAVDNEPQDYNREAGLVVLAQGTVSASDSPVTGEVRFDPRSGQVAEMSARGAARFEAHREPGRLVVTRETGVTETVHVYEDGDLEYLFSDRPPVPLNPPPTGLPPHPGVIW